LDWIGVRCSLTTVLLLVRIVVYPIRARGQTTGYVLLLGCGRQGFSRQPTRDAVASRYHDGIFSLSTSVRRAILPVNIV